MTLRVLVLTTETPHHVYFLERVSEHCELSVVVETRPFAPRDLAREEFEQHSRDVERHRWYPDGVPDIRDVAESASVESINSRTALAALSDFQGDVAISFGTSIFGPESLALLPGIRLNLHGGDPERYRGLDSHLWSIYHGDFKGLATSLHELIPSVDAGDLFGLQPFDLRFIDSLESLRSVNTEAATDLSLQALAIIDRNGTLIGRPQVDASRYYSTLPGSLLERCQRMFSRMKAEANAVI